MIVCQIVQNKGHLVRRAVFMLLTGRSFVVLSMYRLILVDIPRCTPKHHQRSIQYASAGDGEPWFNKQ